MPPNTFLFSRLPPVFILQESCILSGPIFGGQVTGNNEKGISSDDDIIINGGTIKITAVGDGLDANDDITINGGYVYINCDGNGIYSNGTVNITSGTVFSLGGNDGISAISTFTITGGTIIATGNSVTSPGSSSAQSSLYVDCGATQAAGTLFYVEQDSSEIITFAPARNYQTVLYSSGSLTEDATYQVYVGGSSSGTATTDGLYNGGSYNAGTTGTPASVTSSVTANVVEITLGDTITVSGSGATVDGSKITITSAGTYSISGTLKDGQIIVNTGDSGTVKLILNGADITYSTSAPIYVVNAEETVIVLADGTENYITDGDSYILEDSASDEPNAAIFSNDDLTINGNGSLIVNANYNNGIQSKDDLEITGGNITVSAVNDGIKGRDSINVKDGIVTVTAGADGMQSNNDEDSGKGYVSIESGTIKITAGEDGIQAETSLIVSGGYITISSGGGSVNSSNNAGGGGDNWGNWGMGNNPDVTSVSTSSGSAKGLKAGVDITITGGIVNIDSSDDSIHSNNSLTINGGDIILASGDDGIHSDSTLEINGGDISITKCYEGIESAVVTINDGDIHLVASDDGINAVSVNDSSLINGRPAQNDFNPSGDNNLYINGGYIVIDATGDGFDINGSITMTGGVVIINGPTSNANGALDYLGTFNISGGFLVAAGSSGMAQAPSTSSAQYSVMLTLSSQSAGTMFHIEDEDGEEILTFVPTKAYQSVVLCSPELEKGATYIAYSGGSSSGTITDGLYSGGTYTAGTQITSFTISSIVTSIGLTDGTGIVSPGGGLPGGGRQ